MLVVATNIINLLTQVALSLAVLMMVWGGIQLAIAGGSEEKVAEGKKTLTQAVIGLAIVLASWLIINELLKLLAGTTGNTNFLPWNQITCTRGTI